MAEMRIICSDNTAISFNNKACKVKSTGRSSRVGVVDHIEFMTQYFDGSVA